MGTIDNWTVIHGERKALAGDLAGLDEEQWASPSLCTGWTVRDVLAHMAGTAKITPAGFFAKLAASGFSFEKLQAKGIASEKGSSPAGTLSHFEAIGPSRNHPPGPSDTMLGETIIHGQDIRWPLRIRHDYPTDALVEVADFYKNSNLIVGTKRRITGLTLRATDADWSHGTGPEVAGPLIALVMAMTGRKPTLQDLHGEGVATLQSRR